MTTHTCDTCQKEKDIEAFPMTGFAYKDRPRMRRNTCRECLNKAKIGKVCPGCKQHRARKRFYADVAQADGLSAYCKTCQDAATLDWRARNKEWHNAYRAEYWRKRRRGLVKVQRAA